VADALRQIEDDRDRENVILASECDERLARLWLDVGRIDYRQLCAGQSPRGHEMQCRKRIVRR
jgi:hypothetical protein